MSSVSASSPLQSYLALPSPASVRASDAKRTAVKATNAAADGQTEDINDLPPIAPVAPVTRQSQQVDNENEQSGDGNSGNGTGSASTGTSAGSPPVGQFSATATAAGTTSATSSSRQSQSRTTASSAAGQASAGFVTQSLSQETIGAGLHIEPWRAAISSYLSAAALPSASWSGGIGHSMVSMTV